MSAWTRDTSRHGRIHGVSVLCMLLPCSTLRRGYLGGLRFHITQCRTQFCLAERNRQQMNRLTLLQCTCNQALNLLVIVNIHRQCGQVYRQIQAAVKRD
ncbi:hypothetical protein D3C80_1856350 [compost metagenome]